MVGKGLIGVLMMDQVLNNYFSLVVLDVDVNIDENDNGIVVEGKSYINMEYKWDEVYGYFYGIVVNFVDLNVMFGDDDSFLNKYIVCVEVDEDFMGIVDDIYNVFKLGCVVIVVGDYKLCDEQVEIICEKVFVIIGICVVYYLQ